MVVGFAKQISYRSLDHFKSHISASMLIGAWTERRQDEKMRRAGDAELGTMRDQMINEQ